MNFIMCMDEELLIRGVEGIINKIMVKSKIEYKTYIYDNANSLDYINGNKIYIIDGDMRDSINYVKNIRASGDLRSPIVVLANESHVKAICFTGRILMLDFINKNDLNKILKKYLKDALGIMCNNSTYNFSYKGDYFSLPYDDIIYFEKILNDNSSIVVCENEDYTVRKTITEIEEELNDIGFLKTHRSCIVNLNKIKKVNYDDGIIYFKDDRIDLLSRSNKKVLRDRMKMLHN